MEISFAQLLAQAVRLSFALALPAPPVSPHPFDHARRLREARATALMLLAAPSASFPVLDLTQLR